jgi:hypothetical protein
LKKSIAQNFSYDLAPITKPQIVRENRVYCEEEKESCEIEAIGFRIKRNKKNYEKITYVILYLFSLFCDYSKIVTKSLTTN